ncbi:SDR family NAD(P)-dependent oxidoreductase [Oceanospirillum beijerinckii]|uniref:SDR family NAD(P)-dependent oxidoreductase n=1 Tax=Oceanospirillum beijerinckii TaxID=64976 RepID=UPI000405CEC9|nr:glucose 1-dehydrogenase [Oceanospirillum beijerinckii]MAC47612.1 SDR family oxidoreductase [Oceanospirillum sp.]
MSQTPTNNKVALVTGGAQGIGKAICQGLLNQGMTVVCADIDMEAAEETTLEYSELGTIQALALDLADEPSVENCIQEIISEFGRLDVLVNNGGLSTAFNDPIEDLSLDDWQRYMDVNLTGVFLACKHAVPYLREQKGNIINIASTRAQQSERDTEAYSATKGGVVSLTHALAISLSGDIRVNCISPGWIEVGDWQKARTRIEPIHSPSDLAQHPVGRIGQPEDVAYMVCYLASDVSGFITGQNFVIDGGMSIKMSYNDN